MGFYDESGEHIGDTLEELLEHAFPESYQRGMLRARPYDGQPHTDHGERGKALSSGRAFEDLRDGFVRAVCLSSGPSKLYEEALKGENALLSESAVYECEDLDLIAVAQNLSCEMERLMGIYPNVPELPEGKD